MRTEKINRVRFLTLLAEWMLMVICRHRDILYTELIELQRKGWPQSRGFLFLWDVNNERETEGRNRQEESPDTAASAETWRRQARPWGLRGNCVPVCPCVYLCGMVRERLGCWLPAVPSVLRLQQGSEEPFLSGPPGNTSDSQPERAHQIDAKLLFAQWIITEATELALCL